MATNKIGNTDLGMFPKSIDAQMGDHFKAIEERSRGVDFIDPSKSFVIRVDGRAFHTFTRGMQRPYSNSLDRWRNAAADAVLRSLKPTFAYHQSDEISYVWIGVPTNSPAIHPFNGRVDKLITLCASLTSTAFFKAYYDDVERVSDLLPHFDGRLAGVFDDPKEALRCVMWRENDAMRNSVQMLAQSCFSHSDLQGKNVFEQYKMCKEHRQCDWKTEVAPQFRRGTYLRRATKLVVLETEHLAKIPEEFRPDDGTLVPRSVTVPLFFNDWDIENRLEVLVD